MENKAYIKLLQTNYDKITNDFVPKNNGYNVYIDITDFSYKIKGNNTTHTKYTEHIKKAALDKIDKINNINKTLISYKQIKHISVSSEPMAKTTTAKIKRNAELDKINQRNS